MIGRNQRIELVRKGYKGRNGDNEYNKINFMKSHKTNTQFKKCRNNISKTLGYHGNETKVEQEQPHTFRDSRLERRKFQLEWNG